MSLYYIVEPNYKCTTAYKEIINGLSDQAKRGRIPLVELDKKILFSEPFIEEDAALVIGVNSCWINNVLSQIHMIFEHRIIVLSGQDMIQSNIPCNLVYANLSDSMGYLFSYLHQYQKSSVAFYGAAPELEEDNRIEHFLRNGGKREDIYLGGGVLEACFEAFRPHMEQYDAIICANGYIAISLVSRLKKEKPELLDRIFIIGYANTRLADVYSPSITSLSLNYQKFGEAAIIIYKNMLNNLDYSIVHIGIRWKLHIRQTTQNLPFEEEIYYPVLPPFQNKEMAEQDQELLEMRRVETLLQSFEKTDKDLVDMVLAGKTYEETAGQMFMSVSSVKYRLKSMYKICGVESRKEFITLLKKYF